MILDFDFATLNFRIIKPSLKKEYTVYKKQIVDFRSLKESGLESGGGVYVCLSDPSVPFEAVFLRASSSFVELKNKHDNHKYTFSWGDVRVMYRLFAPGNIAIGGPTDKCPRCEGKNIEEFIFYSSWELSAIWCHDCLYRWTPTRNTS